MTDIIQLTGLSATGYHGVLPEERRNGQVFVVDVAILTDTSTAAVTDDLRDSADYSAVAASVVAIIEGEAVNLIETLADRIARTCLASGNVFGVRVTVHKPQAPVGVAFEDVSVTIERGATRA